MAAHDEGPAIINDHAFEPKGAWFTLCRHCNLGEAAHSETTIRSADEIREDFERQMERTQEGRRVEIAYFSDDNTDDD